MKDKIIKYLIAIPLTAIALLPWINIKIPLLVNSEFWFWMILINGFLSFAFLYSKAGIPEKLIIVYSFINCFFSKAPHLSFTAQTLLIIMAYFYLLCLELKDYRFIFRTIQCIFLVNMVLILNQMAGRDVLLNFGKDIPTYIGNIGNPMILSSFLVILGSFLIIYRPLNLVLIAIIAFIFNSTGATLSLIVAGGTYIYCKFKKRGKQIVFVSLTILITCFVADNKIEEFYQLKGGRFPIWRKTVELTNQHPITGWGIATYKVIFPQLSKEMCSTYYGMPGPWEFEGTTGVWVAWRQTHNCWLQILFEMGYIGFALFLIYVGSLIYYFIVAQKSKIVMLSFAGLVMIGANMMIHFPTRTLQCVPIIVCFVAYYKRVMKGELQ